MSIFIDQAHEPGIAEQADHLRLACDILRSKGLYPFRSTWDGMTVGLEDDEPFPVGTPLPDLPAITRAEVFREFARARRGLSNGQGWEIPNGGPQWFDGVKNRGRPILFWTHRNQHGFDRPLIAVMVRPMGPDDWILEAAPRYAWAFTPEAPGPGE